jgi:hypothetical protein
VWSLLDTVVIQYDIRFTPNVQIFRGHRTSPIQGFA